MRCLAALWTVIMLGTPTLGWAAPGLAPPFVRKWTALTGSLLSVVVVRDGALIYSSSCGLGSLDVRTGRARWRALRGKRIDCPVVCGETAYCLASSGIEATLMAVCLRSGRSRALAGLTRGWLGVAAAQDRAFVLSRPGIVTAFDGRTGAAMWSRRLVPVGASDRTFGHIAAVDEGVYVALQGFGQFGLANADGSSLWERPGRAETLAEPVVCSGRVVTQWDRVAGIDMTTGKPAWVSTDHVGAVARGDVLVAAGVSPDRDHVELRGRDPISGRLLWCVALGSPVDALNTTFARQVLVTPDEAWVHDEPVECYTTGGKLKWSSPSPFDGFAAFVGDGFVVVTDNDRLRCYVPGSLPSPPTTYSAKRLLAARLLARFSELDASERALMVGLEPHVFRPLAARCVAWAERRRTGLDGVCSDDRQTGYGDAVAVLESTYRPEYRREAVAAWCATGAPSLSRIAPGSAGHDDLVPLMVDSLGRLPHVVRRSSPAIEHVASSSHPAAVRFMIGVLGNPDASVEWRTAAYLSLPTTGGQPGLAALRSMRRKRGSRKPWFERISLAAAERYNIRGRAEGPDGRAWMLFSSGALGNWSDLFVAPRCGARWGRPLFTGAWTDRTWDADAPKTHRGIPTELLVSSEWARVFTDDPSITLDSDQDGLTDLVEARLGSNPNKLDTDGDSLRDAVDPCPNAAPRALDDTEKIMAAAIEAQYLGQEMPPAVLRARGIAPFELYGYDGILMWDDDREHSPLGAMYGGGVQLLWFSRPTVADPGAGVVVYDTEGTTARTMINRQSGGLNGDGTLVTLKKIDGEWFVTKLTGVWVS